LYETLTSKLASCHVQLAKQVVSNCGQTAWDDVQKGSGVKDGKW